MKHIFKSYQRWESAEDKLKLAVLGIILTLGFLVALMIIGFYVNQPNPHF